MAMAQGGVLCCKKGARPVHGERPSHHDGVSIEGPHDGLR